MKKWYFIIPLLLQKIIWIPTRILLFVFGRLELKGLENLRGISTNVIFASNHTGEADVFMIPGSLPFFSRFSPIFYTSRENKFYKNSGWRKHFYGGTFFKAWGAYPVAVGLNDYGRALAHQVRIIGDGGSLYIFPEGKVTPDGTIQEAKGGVAYLAYVTGVPIIPVRLEGTYRMTLFDVLMCKRRLKITYGAPVYITPTTVKIDSVDDFKKYANELVMGKVR